MISAFGLEFLDTIVLLNPPKKLHLSSKVMCAQFDKESLQVARNHRCHVKLPAFS